MVGQFSTSLVTGDTAAPLQQWHNTQTGHYCGPQGPITRHEWRPGQLLNVTAIFRHGDHHSGPSCVGTRSGMHCTDHMSPVDSRTYLHTATILTRLELETNLREV